MQRLESRHDILWPRRRVVTDVLHPFAPATKHAAAASATAVASPLTVSSTRIAEALRKALGARPRPSCFSRHESGPILAPTITATARSNVTDVEGAKKHAGLKDLHRMFEALDSLRLRPLMRLASYFDGAACQYVWADDVGADHVADQRGAMRLASTRARERLGALRRDGDQATPA
ncbi:hypothetical protein AK812_SmicGene37601 [Symbiodinium microadriaticum]|uniref:Uncharacterized protein n=1 Tax=Symbiodinium microadriaticum TaxID=2951 RepID=A0A1Q9CFU8_SYMMI|nr:hypothetical protein AK812_SmicGene37601 [Symbiodinium microadriaticum]CAE7837825.1 unnamed protein product [Symbiodinium microadriaticum]